MKLINDYNNLITKDENQEQYLLHVPGTENHIPVVTKLLIKIYFKQINKLKLKFYKNVLINYLFIFYCL